MLLTQEPSTVPAAPVVVDVETTGFGKHDKIVEIAIVAMDPESWETVDEYDTLLNPERDMGPTGVHGISASMVEVAPVFGDVIADVAKRLNGALLVAHNLPFDSRMLRQEFERNGIQVDLGSGLCTLRETRQNELVCAYLDALDWVLDDGVIDQTERTEIKRLARDLGVPERDRIKAHRDYFDCIVAAAKRDGVVSPAEHEIIARIADQLELAGVEIPDPTPVATVEKLAAGDRVCFTGTAFVGGETWTRDDMEALARRAGLAPVRNVTKKGCDLLVAADVASASSKARTARKYGKPIVSVADFLAWAGVR